MTKSTVLPLLASGDFRSGQDLAQALGVSRTAVWKQLKKLSDDFGLEVESVKGRGYRIRGGIDLLDAQRVRAHLSSEAGGLLRELEILDTVGSTNERLMQRASAERGSGASLSGICCTAEHQSAGRGRRGRQWVSPYASNMYLSVLWEFEEGAGALEGLSLAVGVAVSRALSEQGIQYLQLKWPNDIVFDGAKLGGILLEMTGDAAGVCQVVVGVGLNVKMPAMAARQIDQAWTDVASMSEAAKIDRSELLARLLSELLSLLASYENQGFSAWRDSWNALDAYADRPVVLEAGERKVAGIARGVDQRGALQLETATGIQSVFGGEISLRPVE